MHRVLPPTVFHIPAFNLYSGFQAKAWWDSDVGSCLFSHLGQILPNIIAELVCDVILLVVMFVGVLNKRSEGKLWRLLYRQVCS